MSLFGLAQRLPRLWYRDALSPQLWPLLPLSWLFAGLAGIRRLLYRRKLLRSARLPVPVIVVGNITVGGSGKTPLVVWLVGQLRARGWRPGVISRGYGGSVNGVGAVTADSKAGEVGDEPLLLARRCGVPVFVGRDRVAAGRALLAAHPECDVIISDDGLQHYRLARDAEVVVFDGRGAGNGRLLPAGPLREPQRRLRSATAVVWNSASRSAAGEWRLPQFRMILEGGAFYALEDPARRCSPEALRGRRLFAVAGIGDPARFFAHLSALGLVFEAHPFPDHRNYTAEDLAFARDGVLLMTEKDAVKCKDLPLYETWVVPVEARIDAAEDGCLLTDLLLEKMNGRSPA